MLKIQFDDKELLAKLEKLVDNAPKMAEDIEKELGNIILESAKKNAPVDTGALRDSITLAETPDGVEVVSDLQYAAAVEYGTSKTRPQPYLRPAADEARGKMSEIAKAVFRQYD